MEILLLSLNEGEKWKTSVGFSLLPDHPTVFGTNQTCLQTPRLAQILQYAMIFFQLFMNEDFFFHFLDKLRHSECS